ncbi:MAG: 6-hydroxymethylpterin diphosphokinase MptE-like protein [Candidatus Thermoplasmatota archaeon]
MKISIPKHFAKVANTANMILDYRFTKKLEKLNSTLSSLHNIHKGKRGFLIGSGPSLNKTNLALLQNEHVIGVNTLYRGLNRFKLSPEYWVVADGKLFQENYKDLFALKNVQLFLTENAARKYLTKYHFYHLYETAQPYVLRNLGSMNVYNTFSTDITKGIYSGGSSVINALQIAFFLGFQEIYLVGCDCGITDNQYRFEDTPVENRIGKGIRGEWQYLFDAYKVCKKAYEAHGRKIFNATVGGYLEVFERKKIEDVVL